jgi:hypothetical protein
VRSTRAKSWSYTITDHRERTKRHPATRAIVAAIGFVCLIALPLGARGEERNKILVLLEQTSPAFLPRLRAELASSGFGVAVVRPSTFPPSRSEIEQLAQQEGATAGLSLIEAGSGVEIWVVDRTSAKTVFREVILGLYDPREAPEVIAIRMVETLRATLMELEHPRSGTVETAPAPEIDVTGNARSPRFWLGVGGGAGYSSGGVGAVGHLELSLMWMPTSRLYLALDGLLSPGRAKIRAPEGEASVGMYLSGASLGGWMNDPSAVVRARAGLGVWASVLALSGAAAAPYVSTHAQIVTAMPHLDLGLRIAMTHRLAIEGTLSGAVSAPGASVRFAGREVATWGRPLVLGGVAIAAALE